MGEGLPDALEVGQVLGARHRASVLPEPRGDVRHRYLTLIC